MKITATLSAIALALASSAQADKYQTGLADLEIISDTGRDLTGFVWYPTLADEGPEEIHGNPVWTGITAAIDAEPATGDFPLVVLSHGMYGNAMNQSWLASALAEQGYIVAAISHPGTSTWLRDPDDARQMWERPGDVSRVIDHFMGDAALASQIDADRIYMGGHSLGGFTAVMLAGGRYDAGKVNGFCGENPDDLICGIFMGWGIGQTPADIARMEADLSDPRISKIAVFDLGGTETFAPDSLAAIETPLLVIGAPAGDSDIDLDRESRALMGVLPASATYLEPETLSHFDFLGVCKPAALDILAKEEPESMFVCADGTAEREADHAMIIDAVSAFFGTD